MDVFKKIELLSEAAKHDVCLSSCSGRKPDPRDSIHHWIYLARLPNGEPIPILKILMDNACQNSCTYCLHRQGRAYPLVNFKSEELANVFMELVRSKFVYGLFLSSCISFGANQMMEKMLKACEIIRKKHKFSGYIHLKLMPGADFCYVQWASELADRISINLEAPSQERLKKIAPEKKFSELVAPMAWIQNLILQEKTKVRSQTTQFVVGAADESDQEILKTTVWLYKRFGLSRVYFSAFQPVANTPLQNHPPTPPIREYRLYQADWLLRRYGFELSELVFDKNGNLPQGYDPKMVWALNHPERFPIEVNTATYEELLRVPGIGHISAKKIISARKKYRFYTLNDLKWAGVILKKATPFILINGRLIRDN